MLGEWPEYPLEELCELIVDCPHSTPKWTDQGVVVLRNQYIRNGRLDLSDPSYTTEEGYESRIKRAVPTAGDLVLTREAPMGEVCKIPEGIRCCLGQRMVLIRANKDLIDPDYLLFAIQSPYVQHQISWSEGTGTTVSNIRLPDLRGFKIPTPSLEIQRWIAGVLKALDEKTTLNRQINTTLESMAQALFKSWFVDFDPVIDNALAAGNEIPDALQKRAARRAALRQQSNKTASETSNKTTGATDAASVEQALPDTGLSEQRLPPEIQQLFPDRFVFTEEMGWVPEGWEPAQIKDIAEYGNSRVDAVEIDRDNYVSTENMLVDKAGVVAASSVPEAAQVPSYEKGSILISNIRPYFKKIWLASHSGGRSNDVLEFKVKAAGTEGYLYSLLCQDSFFEYMMATSKGTKMPRGDKQAIMNWAVAVPSVDLRELFSEQVSLFQDSVVSRNEQSVSLENLRDSLLPKLLSGQITIPDAEQQLAEVL